MVSVISRPEVVGLVATHSRLELLRQRSLPSIAAQTYPLSALVVVQDDSSKSLESLKTIVSQILSGMCSTVVMQNSNEPGAAGAWNTGLDYISAKYPESYVAILDDDDTWDPDHIETCMTMAEESGWSEVVLSGLRLCKDGELVPRSPVSDVTVNDFLAGNPGWQGSNTFVSIRTLKDAGMFTGGLRSTNDRDLAIRILSLPTINVAYTLRHSSTWYLESDRMALSTPGSESKAKGLSQFMKLHGHRMDDPTRDAFYDRAKRLFGLSISDIDSASREHEH